MATAEEILAGAVEAIPDAEVKNKVIRIDSNLRTMSIPAEFGPLGVESDDDVNKVQFEIPRYYGEIDLSTFEVRINYMNANGDGDIYDVIDLNIVEDNLMFSWLVGSLALAYKGDVKFIVCFKKLNEDFTVSKEFNTTLASLPVLEGLEPSKHLIDVYPDIIERMLRYMEAPISSEQIYTAVENYLKNNPIISEHNLSKEAHEDIRQLILGLTNRLNALANSDDTTLDQLNEIVAYIKNNKGLIDAITTSKVSTSDIVNNLVTNVGTKVLSAAQGVALKAMIDEAVKKSGGTMTGSLAVTTLDVKSNNNYKNVSFKTTDDLNVGYIQFNADANKRRFSFNHYPADQDGNETRFIETYTLPTADAGRTKTGYYDILTSKKPVTIPQGGTGATTAEQARANLGITPENIGALSSALPASASVLGGVKIGAGLLVSTDGTVNGAHITTTVPSATYAVGADVEFDKLPSNYTYFMGTVDFAATAWGIVTGSSSQNNKKLTLMSSNIVESGMRLRTVVLAEQAEASKIWKLESVIQITFSASGAVTYSTQTQTQLRVEGIKVY